MYTYIQPLDGTQISAVHETPAIADEFFMTGNAPDLGELTQSISVDKYWHSLNYVLTGSAWSGDEPLNFLIKGGNEVESVDAGYGPPRTYSSYRVKRIHTALLRLSQDHIRERATVQQFESAEIYPNIWARDYDDASLCEDMKTQVQWLTDSIGGLVERQLGFMIWLS